MIKLLVASHNLNKIKEFKSLLFDQKVEIVSLKDLNETDDVIEDGLTFFENAYLKASYFAKKHQMMTVSDDSGIVIEALGGRPGIYSARYSGKGDLENNQLVLSEMKEKENRSAYFISSVVLCYPNGEYKSYEGRVYGEIHNKMVGTEGFGYDSIFYYIPFHKTFAEVSLEDKNKVSHRAKALDLFKEDIDEILNYE
jgi:XTP/dITP diphosphohydrolase